MFKKNRRLFKKGNLPDKLFKPAKPNTKIKTVLRVVEIILVLLVIAGTIGLVNVNSGRFLNFLEKRKSALFPRVQIVSPIKEAGFQEKLIRSLPKGIFDPVKTTETKEGNLQVTSKQSITAIFSKEKDIAFQVSTLQTILIKAKIDKKKVKTIDFRFEKVVV